MKLAVLQAPQRGTRAQHAGCSALSTHSPSGHGSERVCSSSEREAQAGPHNLETRRMAGLDSAEGALGKEAGLRLSPDADPSGPRSLR